MTTGRRYSIEQIQLLVKTAPDLDPVTAAELVEQRLREAELARTVRKQTRAMRRDRLSAICIFAFLPIILLCALAAELEAGGMPGIFPHMFRLVDGKITTVEALTAVGLAFTGCASFNIALAVQNKHAGRVEIVTAIWRRSLGRIGLFTATFASAVTLLFAIGGGKDRSLPSLTIVAGLTAITISLAITSQNWVHSSQRGEAIRFSAIILAHLYEHIAYLKNIRKEPSVELVRRGLNWDRIRPYIIWAAIGAVGSIPVVAVAGERLPLYYMVVYYLIAIIGSALLTSLFVWLSVRLLAWILCVPRYPRLLRLLKAGVAVMYAISIFWLFLSVATMVVDQSGIVTVMPLTAMLIVGWATLRTRYPASPSFEQWVAGLVWQRIWIEIKSLKVARENIVARALREDTRELPGN